eukprot:gene6577-7080_t
MSTYTPLSIILEIKATVLSHRAQKLRQSSYSTEELIQHYESLLTFAKSDSCIDALMELKQFVLEHGIPSGGPCTETSQPHSPFARTVNNTGIQNYGSDCLRAKIWKLLLGVPLYFDVDSYVRKSEEVNNSYDNKIKDDAFRTFKVDEDFWSRTNEDVLIRILKALSHDVGYVQGINVLLGPFLYVMPELDAYYCCHTLCTEHIPSYIRKNLEGVHSGISLLDKCLKLLDPKLYQYIIYKVSDLRIFALKYILTLMANVQPLSEVLKIWDSIFAFGVHFSIILFCCYLINIRDELLAEPSSFKICTMIEKGSLDSELLIKMGLASIEFIPTDVYEELIDHIY